MSNLECQMEEMDHDWSGKRKPQKPPEWNERDIYNILTNCQAGVECFLKMKYFKHLSKENNTKDTYVPT